MAKTKDYQTKWKQIEGSPNHEVSNKGQVRRGEKLLKCNPGSTGRPQTTLSFDGTLRTEGVHVLVAEAFCPKPITKERLDVHHIDGDITNNRFTNLVFLTRSNHMKLEQRTGGLAKINPDQFKDILRSYEAYVEMVAQKFDLNPTYVRQLVSGKSTAWHVAKGHFYNDGGRQSAQELARRLGWVFDEEPDFVLE